MAATVDQKLLKQTKFPPEFSKKVDMKKVNVEVMKKWISGKISEILGNEDDVVIELCFNLLEGARFPDIKVLQIQLTGFLEKDTPKFCKELWNLCLSAQDNAQGVPKELLEAKKLELIQEKIEAEKAAEANRRRKEAERQRDRNIENIRNRERSERGRGRGRGGRFDHGGHRAAYSDRSPPPSWRRGHSRDRSLTPPRREGDSYTPRGRGSRSHAEHRYRSSPRRHPNSRSQTPPRRRRNTSSGSSNAHVTGGPKDGKGLPRSPPRRRRPRSDTSASESRSPSPRPRRGRDVSRSLTPSSRSPRRRERRYTSGSRSGSPSPPRRSGRRGQRSLSNSSSSDKVVHRKADQDKGRSTHNRPSSRSGRRNLSRSVSSSPPRKSRRARDNESRSRSSSRSPSRDRRAPEASGQDHKRQRSLERYQAAPRRRRNSSSSSHSLPHREKRRRADDSQQGKSRGTREKPREVGRDSSP